MNLAVPSDLPIPRNPARDRTRRAVNYTRRHAALAGLLLWASAAAVLGLHSSHLALPDPSRFAMADSWLIGLGCLGCPILPMRSLGRWLSPQTCMLVAAFSFALAMLLTALTLGGALHFDPLIAAFAVILPEAAGIQAINAADAEVHAVRREEEAYRRGRLDAVAEQADLRCRAIAGLDRLQSMNVGELTSLIEVANGLIDGERSSHQTLHLVAQPGAGRPGGRVRSSRFAGTAEGSAADNARTNRA